MADAFHFSDRLFQRGQTWQELVESWQHQRLDFLNAVAQAHPLKSCRNLIQSWPSQLRLAVYFAQWSIDSRKALAPFGKTLADCANVSLRFFSQEIFFHKFRHALGRNVPLFLILGSEGVVTSTWGPRPEPLTQELNDRDSRKGKEIDQWLLQVPDHKYASLLDQSVADFLLSEMPTQVT